MSSRWPVLRDFQCYSRFRNISAQTRQLEVSQVSPRVVEKDQHRPLVMMQLSAVLGQSRAGLCVSDRFLVLVYSLNALVMIRWLIISIWQLESKWLHSMRMLRVILGWLHWRCGCFFICAGWVNESQAVRAVECPVLSLQHWIQHVVFLHGLQEKDKHLFCSVVLIREASKDSFGSIRFPLEEFRRKPVQSAGRVCAAFVFSLMKAGRFMIENAWFKHAALQTSW